MPRAQRAPEPTDQVEYQISTTEQSDDPSRRDISARGPEPAPDSDASNRPHTAHQYPDEPGKLDNIADKLGFRDWLERNPALKHSYRVVVGIVGFIVVVAGLIMIPFPGPGWLVVIAGLAILATEFTWAKRLLDFTKKHVKAWTSWVGRQSVVVKILLAVLTAAFVYGIIVVALHLTGVPGWLPEWIPLWR